ncbi:hypothetical protein B0H13DRAFT_2525290 [Mycena leptocephala]|nr:hypothetical protein B0H13DRAFT_2525290 [Mycena leptocephala]
MCPRTPTGANLPPAASTAIGRDATVQIIGLGSGANVDVGGGLAPAPVFEKKGIRVWFNLRRANLNGRWDSIYLGGRPVVEQRRDAPGSVGISIAIAIASARGKKGELESAHINIASADVDSSSNVYLDREYTDRCSNSEYPSGAARAGRKRTHGSRFFGTGCSSNPQLYMVAHATWDTRPTYGAYVKFGDREPPSLGIPSCAVVEEANRSCLQIEKELLEQKGKGKRRESKKEEIAPSMSERKTDRVVRILYTVAQARGVDTLKGRLAPTQILVKSDLRSRTEVGGRDLCQPVNTVFALMDWVTHYWITGDRGGLIGNQVEAEAEVGLEEGNIKCPARVGNLRDYEWQRRNVSNSEIKARGGDAGGGLAPVLGGSESELESESGAWGSWAGDDESITVARDLSLAIMMAGVPWSGAG